MENINYNEIPVTDYYGKYCFNDAVMKEKLSKEIYTKMKAIQNGESRLTPEIADVVANAMKEWAIENGATHYSHWFQPLTGLTAEKYDSFINPVSGGKVVMEFSGKELIVGEPDASSFPNGGLRATFEARGYTAWDTSSPVFLKPDKTGLVLTIPTAFFSFTGVALDKKTPLLRSMEAIDRSAMRLLKVLGNTTSKRVISSVGPEQEYFLVKKELFEKRPDLKLCGRTVFGTLGAKGQEKDDHYFGVVKEEVAEYMRELNQELWKLGISAKTQHNEVAPNQFELASVFDTTNGACDSNQMVMETMKRVANHHGMVCLLHEKPFAGVNGSGKHNNWSIETDDGIRLMKPGKTPQHNAQFLLFLVAFIKAMDDYAPILRASAAISGNDHRLGGNEAPPAVISIFLGEQLEGILESIALGRPFENQEGEEVSVGVTTIPRFPKDMTDRNRTSPIAFTGNKFEFRMVGSSQSLAGPNVVMNTAVAEVLDLFSTRIENLLESKGAEGGASNPANTDLINLELSRIIGETYLAHKRIVFNGNGYSKEWEEEAEKRGLANIKATVYAIPEYEKDYSVELFENHKVLNRQELEARVDTYMENYSHELHIEAGTMIEMSNRYIVPAVARYINDLSNSAINLKKVGVTPSKSIISLIKQLNSLLDQFRSEELELEATLERVRKMTEVKAKAVAYYEEVALQMEAVRYYGDKLERLCDKSIWPLPSYEDLLFTL